MPKKFIKKKKDEKKKGTLNEKKIDENSDVWTNYLRCQEDYLS